MRELAVSGSSEEHGGRRAKGDVLSAERRVLLPAILLGHVRLVVIAQAVIQGQLLVYLPAILEKKTDGVIAELGVGGLVELQVVGEARKEAGVGETGRFRCA